MNSFEWFLLLTLIASLVVGPLMGFAAGRRAERNSCMEWAKRLSEKYDVGRPE